MNKENLFNAVEKKTNVKKEDIIKLAQSLSSEDLNNEDSLRKLIKSVSVLANKNVSKEKEDKIISAIKSNKVPKDIDKLL